MRGGGVVSTFIKSWEDRDWVTGFCAFTTCFQSFSSRQFLSCYALYLHLPSEHRRASVN